MLDRFSQIINKIIGLIVIPFLFLFPFIIWTEIRNLLIDVEFPNLENEDINKIYFLTKEKHRPGQLKNSKPEIKPESEGGMSYWSMRTHRWVLPKLDKQTKKYIPPQKNH